MVVKSQHKTCYGQYVHQYPLSFEQALSDAEAVLEPPPATVNSAVNVILKPRQPSFTAWLWHAAVWTDGPYRNAIKRPARHLEGDFVFF